MKLKRLNDKELTIKKSNLKKLKLKWLAVALAVFFVIYITGTAISIWRYGKIDEKQKADVAIVLGAATYGEKVSPVYEERLNHGIWLYENGYVEKLIVTGGVGAGNPHSDSYVAKQYMMEQGIRSEDILMEEKSTITQENIKNAKELMDAYSYSSAIIVSDPLHMKRAMLMAREEFFYIGYRLWGINL